MIEQKPDALTSSLDEMERKHPNRVPWTAPQTFRAVLLTLIPWVVFTLLLNALGGSTSTTQPLTLGADITGAVVAFIFTGLIEGVFLLAPIYYARQAIRSATQTAQVGTRAIFAALGLRRFHAMRTIPLILGLMLLIVGFDALYAFIIQIFHLNIMTNDQVLLQQSAGAPLTTYGLLLASVLLAPFCEELFFRGLVLPGLLKEMAPIWAVLVSAALFAIAHVDLASFAPLFAIGCALGYLRLRSNSAWATISLHMLNNALASLLIVLAMQHVPVPNWL